MPAVGLVISLISISDGDTRLLSMLVTFSLFDAPDPSKIWVDIFGLAGGVRMTTPVGNLGLIAGQWLVFLNLVSWEPLTCLEVAGGTAAARNFLAKFFR